MSFHSGTQVEYSTASGTTNNNGGIFSSTIANAGTDYSQQATAQVTGTDGACTTGTSTFTSASPSASFTSALIGNGLTLSTGGSNFTLSTYQITAVSDGNTLTLDRSPVGGSSGTGGVYKIGGAFAVPIDAHKELLVGGNRAWVKGAVNFTLLASISVSANNATFAAPIIISGYNTTRGDNPTGANRPTLVCGTSYVVTLQSFWHIENFIMTGDASSILTLGSAGGIARNIKSTNSSGTTTRSAINPKGGVVIECEAVSTNGYAIANDTNALALLLYTYMHDSVTGAQGSSFGRFSAHKCVFDTLTTGLLQTSAPVRTTITDCDFYNGTTALSLAGATDGVIDGNIFHSWTTAITDTSTNLSNVIKRNSFYNNTTNAENVGTLDSSNLTSDPSFTDAPNKDFTVGSSSPVLNAGFDFTELGLVGAYKNNIGIDQDDNASGGSATWAHASFG